MRWIIGGVLALVLVVGFFVVTSFLPRSSGDGWRLDPEATWDPGVAGGGSPTVTLYGSDTSSVGIGVTAYGSSSCPPELRGVEIDEVSITVTIGEPIAFGGCTADLGPHLFGISVERSRLPDVPFNVVVRHDERPVTVTMIESLP